jgi:hypothetical protein
VFGSITHPREVAGDTSFRDATIAELAAGCRFRGKHRRRRCRCGQQRHPPESDICETYRPLALAEAIVSNRSFSPQDAQATGANDPRKQQSSLKARAVSEIKKFLIITLYLWVLFALFSLHRTLILEQEHLNYEEQGFAIVNALIFAKVILIAEDLKLGNRFKNYPLIHSVIWRSALFAVLLVCFHIAEKALGAWLHNKPLGDSLSEFGNGGIQSILAVGAIVFVMLIPFFMFTELSRVLGEYKLWRLLVARDRRSIALEVQE